MLVGSAFLLFVFSETSKRISKVEGTLMLIVFVIYYTLVFVI